MRKSGTKTVLISILVLVILAIAGISLFRGSSANNVEANTDSKKPQITVERGNLLSDSEELYKKLKAENDKITASIKPYEIKPNLTNVVNLKIFKDLLSPNLITMIAKNGFAASPTNYTQLFHIYETNEYAMPNKIPAFITTDAMLHQYHLFYDFSLREIESDKLFDVAVKLTDCMLAASLNDMKSASDPKIKDAATRNAAYFAVARNLLTNKIPPSEVAQMANAEIKLIKSAGGREYSNIVKNVLIDYSQFIPRGHYTRSQKLQKYFRVFMLYGLTPFPLPNENIDESPTLQALLITKNIQNSKIGDTTAKELWETIFEPTAFYVGNADDHTFYEYNAVSNKVFGAEQKIDGFADSAKLNDFIDYAKSLPGPGIENYVFADNSSTGPQFRFMGQRFIPDSRILQEMTHPKVDKRNFPFGLDVLAAMGSDRALEILKSEYNENEYTGYNEQMDKMRGETSNTPEETWRSNLYYGWLWSLQSIIEPAPEGYPQFMRNQAWLDKSLFTALASWTELRHDTILYAKQSGAEFGGGEEPTPIPKGYVEPNLEFWTRLKWLNDSTLAGLKSRSLLTPRLQSSFEQLGEWIDFCRNITIKELTNTKVTDDEYLQMEIFGADMEAMFLNFAGGDLLSEADKDMAVVADVHTSFDSVLEEGVGRAAQIFVVVPIEGKLYLTRGAIFTHYEFIHPASNRLTDEEWQSMLKNNEEPEMARWIDSFFDKNAPKPKSNF